MDHFLSWDWAVFIFYPSPLSKPLIFCISQLQTAPNTTQSGLTPPCSASWEQKSQSHCICPVVWPKSATLSKGYCSWAVWNKEQEKGKTSPRMSSRDRRIRWLQADNTCQWQNAPTPECFTAISGRTWFGLEVLPVCNSSKQKHWSAYAEAEKGIKLKYYCCFADNLSQQYKLEVRGCPRLPSQGICLRPDLHRFGFPTHAMNFLPSAEAFIDTCENTTDWLKPDPWSVALTDETPTILGPKVLPSLSLQKAGDNPQPTGCCCPPYPGQAGWGHLCRKNPEGGPGSTVWCHRTVKPLMWFGRCLPWFPAWQWVEGSQEGGCFH